MVQDIDISQTAGLAPSSEVSIAIPAGISDCPGASKLIGIAFGSLRYSGLTTDNDIRQSPIFSVNLYCDGVRQNVQDLHSPIQLHFLVKSEKGKEVLSQIKQGTLTQQQALAAQFFKCQFYNATSNSLSSAGCEMASLNQTSITCECNHMTNFLSFFNKGAEVLMESNYNVWLALPQITLSSLKTNIGFHITCSYWLLYCIIGFLLFNSDRKILRKKRIILLYLQTHNIHDTDQCNTTELELRPQPVQSWEGSLTSNTEKRIQIKNQKPSLKNLQNSTHRIHLDNSLVLDSEISVQTRRTDLSNEGKILPHTKRPTLPPLFKLSINKRKPPGACLKEKKRVQQQIIENSQQKKNCCTCYRIAKRELTETNMILGLCTKTSPLYSRCVRWSVLLQGILTDIVLCALFFNLEPIEDSLQFWDSLAENVWVGLYSVVLSIPPTLILVLSFHFPDSILRSFEETTSFQELKKVYRIHERRLQCQRCLGFSLFFAISNFLCLYLVAFGHIASIALQKNWLQSSGASLLIDLIAFEVLPALFFGFVGLLIFSCDCKCCLCALVSLDFYRVFRNVAA